MPLGNFGQIATFVFRSAQPDEEGWSTLRRLGVKAVVKLSDETEYPTAIEARDAGPGVQIQATTVNQWNPDVATVRGIANLIQTFANAGLPTLVHCMHGRDRTGLAIGAWRLIYCGWTFDQVQNERAAYGVTGIIALADHEITECLKGIAGGQNPSL